MMGTLPSCSAVPPQSIQKCSCCVVMWRGGDCCLEAQPPRPNWLPAQYLCLLWRHDQCCLPFGYIAIHRCRKKATFSKIQSHVVQLLSKGSQLLQQNKQHEYTVTHYSEEEDASNKEAGRLQTGLFQITMYSRKFQRKWEVAAIIRYCCLISNDPMLPKRYYNSIHIHHLIKRDWKSMLIKGYCSRDFLKAKK